MSIKSIINHYEKEWQVRIKKEENEDFYHYERNWILPPLFKQREKVLDLGSGNSIVGEYLQKHHHCDVTALDFSAEAIRAAKKRGVKGIVQSVEEKLPFKKGIFDMVFWGDNIEHVWDPESILREIHRILKPKGRLILSTPNQAYWRYRLYMFFKGALPKTEGTPNKPWHWTHIRFFNRNILKALLSLVKFKVVKFSAVSRRRLDKPFLKLTPELFGMIIVLEAKKL